MRKQEVGTKMSHAHLTSPAHKNVVRLIRNIRDQVGLAMLDLEAGADPEKLRCRLIFIEEFSRNARVALVPNKSSTTLDPTG